MPTDSYMHHPTARLTRRSLSIFAGLILIIGLAIGAGRIALTDRHNLIADPATPQVQFEDWHGNVRRSGHN